MTRVDIGPTLLQKELKEAQNRLAQKPERWVGHEKVGRVLHWMGDPSAKDYLKKAAHIRLKTLRPGKVQGWELIAIGNYFCLAGDQETANNYFLRAYIVSKNEVGNINNPDEIFHDPLDSLVIACFVLGKYEEVLIYGEIFRRYDPDPKLYANEFITLAEAKLANNTDRMQYLIDDMAARLSKGIKLGWGKIQTTGGVMPFDLYELAIKMLVEMKS